uniref:tRNA (cytidine/uridine-2'-O-)-methyltransferase TrmJ n=1 Tax=Candidatus Kentrum sp. MB TaxID=2138164 RepID=A0A450XMT6_9GAMM|nr:MAG: tRNA (cytidine32/uridine32-2'-O)-methyltransferase [Candidatus Kentron sp. MB]VFK30611.1 MAG: tRNA (cytidine32/uridine32-2'-O)-methyltransferase [Candidatus Kentron sp. MB]VFK75320.1 MAG: tRNA (cytidine32/uridine32-2'-O)-methyltransferase [Candidatus Kentron sp. MB]
MNQLPLENSPPHTFDNISIILVGTTHPGNIGAVARAMKTMGLRRLSLVNPKRFPCAEATARAAGADDVLYTARVFDVLPAALADCHWVIGTSARIRSIQWPEFTPRECAQRVLEIAREGTVALVFGREHSGLTNQELDHCHAVLRIPTNPEYRSLNLASAVQISAYELRMALSNRETTPTLPVADQSNAISALEREGLYRHLEVSLQEIGYYDPEKPKKLMRRLRRFFNRANPDRSELNILRGILSAAQKASKRGSNRSGAE